MLDSLIICRSISASGESSFPLFISPEFLLEISILILRFFQVLPLGTEKRNTVGDMRVKMGRKR